MSQLPSLKRSQKNDFFENSNPITRERSFIRPNKDQTKRRTNIFPILKGNKPTMEIYRPPNVRTDSGGKLNVHAKEFIMNHELQMSKSSGNLMYNNYENASLMHSKSSGNILRNYNTTYVPIMAPLPLLHSHVLNHVGFNKYTNDGLAHQILLENHLNFQSNKGFNNLKRSKSMGASDANIKSHIKEDFDLNSFSPEDQPTIKQALDDSSQLSSRAIMDLVKMIMEHVVQGLRYCKTSAKLCILIIENEKNNTFLESLLNICQQWYQERDKILRGIKTTDGTRFTAFMWFLTEMSSQLKRHQIQEQFDVLQPDLVLLSLLVKCCQACLLLPIQCLSEIECLFFVLTSIGKDLESELPQQLELLLENVRDRFLSCADSIVVRRTLLQLIELHASNWKLAGTSVMYYYPRVK